MKTLIAVILLLGICTFFINENSKAVDYNSQVYFNVILSGSGNSNATVSLRNNDSGQIWYFTNTGGGNYEIPIPDIKNPNSWSIFACTLTGGGTGTAGADTTFVYDEGGSENFPMTLSAGCSGTGN
jgi:hypothetical protein